MKIKILFVVICTVGMVHAQDYYPLNLGNEWVYNMLDSEKNIIGQDTARCESVFTSGDTTFYVINNYVDTISGGVDQSTTVFYNGISDSNEIYRKATNKLLFFKHQYIDGEIYSNMFLSFTAKLIGNYVIGAETFSDSYYLKINMMDSTGFIFAPDIGIIGVIEESILIRELKAQNIGYVIRDSMSICDGDSVLIHSEYQKERGTYIDSLTSEQGIDSILITKLTVNPFFEVNVDVTICDNESYFAGGEIQNTEGTYYDTLSTIYGCDSVIITDLTVNPIQRSISDVSICDGEEYLAGGENQTEAGEYYDTLSTVLGCDSIVITKLTVKATSENSVDVDICEGESHLAGGAEQTSSGTYYDTLTAANGCDSVLTTNLTVSACADLLKELSAGALLIYPNPSSGIVFVEAEDVLSVEVYNLAGELQLTTTKLELDLTEYPQGTYFIRCNFTNGEHTLKKLVLEE